MCSKNLRGETVVVHNYMCGGTLTGDGPDRWMAEVARSGLKCWEKCCSWTVFNDENKITSMKTYWDSKNFWKQCGIMGHCVRAGANMEKTMMSGGKDTSPCWGRFAQMKFKPGAIDEIMKPDGDFHLKFLPAARYVMAKDGVLDVHWLIDRKNDKMGAYDVFTSKDVMQKFLETKEVHQDLLGYLKPYLADDPEMFVAPMEIWKG